MTLSGQVGSCVSLIHHNHSGHNSMLPGGATGHPATPSTPSASVSVDLAVPVTCDPPHQPPCASSMLPCSDDAFCSLLPAHASLHQRLLTDCQMDSSLPLHPGLHTLRALNPRQGTSELGRSERHTPKTPTEEKHRRPRAQEGRKGRGWNRQETETAARGSQILAQAFALLRGRGPGQDRRKRRCGVGGPPAQDCVPPSASCPDTPPPPLPYSIL